MYGADTYAGGDNVNNRENNISNNKQKIVCSNCHFIN